MPNTTPRLQPTGSRDVSTPHDVCGPHGAAPADMLEVRELMSSSPLTVLDTTPVLEARHLMQGKRIRHLLVTSSDGSLQGIVTDRDIRLNLPSPATSLSVWELNYLLAKLTVAQVMSRPLVSTWPQARLVDAARVMLEHKLGALPVIDDGRLVGILTESDFVKAFAGMARVAG